MARTVGACDGRPGVWIKLAERFPPGEGGVPGWMRLANDEAQGAGRYQVLLEKLGVDYGGNYA